MFCNLTVAQQLLYSEVVREALQELDSEGEKKRRNVSRRVRVRVRVGVSRAEGSRCRPL